MQEFLRAYGKNNTGPRSEKAIREYLSLYTGSRLKIREAKERGFDTLPQLVADLNNLRQQIIPSYLNDKESVNKLVEEAFVRSKKRPSSFPYFHFNGPGRTAGYGSSQEKA